MPAMLYHWYKHVEKLDFSSARDREWLMQRYPGIRMPGRQTTKLQVGFTPTTTGNVFERNVRQSFKPSDTTTTDSGGKAIAAVIGEQIEGAVSNVSVAGTFTPRTKILAQTGEARLAQLPDVPTFKELGIDIVKYHWRGLFIKKGTPEALIERNYAMIKAGVASARFQKYLKDSGTIEGTISRTAMADMLTEQARNDTQLLKQLKMIP